MHVQVRILCVAWSEKKKKVGILYVALAWSVDIDIYPSMQAGKARQMAWLLDGAASACRP